MFKLGLIVNPYAGLGGSVGLKGSDGDAIRAEAIARGAEPRALQRMERALHVIANFREQIKIFALLAIWGKPVPAHRVLPRILSGLHNSNPAVRKILALLPLH